MHVSEAATSLPDAATQKERTSDVFMPGTVNYWRRTISHLLEDILVPFISPVDVYLFSLSYLYGL